MFKFNFLGSGSGTQVCQAASKVGIQRQVLQLPRSQRSRYLPPSFRNQNHSVFSKASTACQVHPLDFFNHWAWEKYAKNSID